MPIKNLFGKQFSKLIVVRKIGVPPGKTNCVWECQCKCGNFIEVPGGYLTSGQATHCGCSPVPRGKTAPWAKKHGLHDTPEYQAYHDMKRRCNNPTTPNYHRYGGRGIIVCPQWERSFEAFYTDMGPRPGKGYSIERRNNDGDYEPGNCYWATRSEQDNNKSSNHYFTIDGECLSISEISRKYGIPRGRLDTRLRKGDSIESALSEGTRYKPMHQYECDGVSKSLKEWSVELGLTYHQLWHQVKNRNKSIKDLSSATDKRSITG